MRHSEAIDYFRAVETSGALIWNRSKPGVRRGMPAGFLFNGTRYVVFERQRVLVKNIVWLLKTGSWPTCTLHHKNGDRTDCRFSNLAARKPKHIDRTFLAIGKEDNGELFLKLNGNMIAKDNDPEVIAQTVRALLVY